jgi:hypothetical protein
MSHRRTFAAATLTLAAIGGIATTVAARDASGYESAITDWPERPRQVAKKIAAAYGQPDEVTPTMLVWHDTGPWKRTIVYREEVKHDFPKPHTDIVEQVIDYKVPVDKFDDLAAFDGSVIVERTKGEMSARCDDEKMNFLAINLANDVVTGAQDADGARRAYAEAAMAVMKKKAPAYTRKLQFTPERDTGDPDQPYRMPVKR